MRCSGSLSVEGIALAFTVRIVCEGGGGFRRGGGAQEPQRGAAKHQTRWTGRRIEESDGARVDLPAILMDVVFVRSKKEDARR